MALRINYLFDVVEIKKDDAKILKIWQLPNIPSADLAKLLKAKGNLSMENKRYWDVITE